MVVKTGPANQRIQRTTAADARNVSLGNGKSASPP